MPQLPKYQRQAGPERYQPYAPRQDYGGAIGQGVANLGQGLMDIGQAIHGALQKLENSQAEMEFGKAVNLTRQRLNDFQLGLSTDQEFMSYEDKYKTVADSINKDIPDVLKTKAAKDKFSLWWEATSEESRFKVAQLSQKKNLEWQIGSLEESINNTISRGDEYAIDDLKALLAGAQKQGLIGNDQYLKILEDAKGKVHERRAQDIATGMGLQEGRDWLLGDKFPEDLQKYVPLDKRQAIADKMYSEYSKQKSIDNAEREKRRDQQMNQAFTDIADDKTILTDEEIDQKYPDADFGEKMRITAAHDAKKERTIKEAERSDPTIHSNPDILDYVNTGMREASGEGGLNDLRLLREYVFEHKRKGIGDEDANKLIDAIDRRADDVIQKEQSAVRWAAYVESEDYRNKERDRIEGDRAQKDKSDELYRTGIRDVEDGRMSEKRIRELGKMGLTEDREHQVRQIWKAWQKEREAKKEKVESDPFVMDELFSMLMNWKTDYKVVEKYLIENQTNGKITGPDALKYRDYALNKKKPAELLTAETTISAFFNEMAKDQWGDKKIETYANAGKIKQIILEEYFEGLTAENEIFQRVNALLKPFNQGLFDKIIGTKVPAAEKRGAPTPAAAKGKTPPPAQKGQKVDKKTLTLMQKGKTGTELYQHALTGDYYRKLTDGTWQKQQDNGSWATE